MPADRSAAYRPFPVDGHVVRWRPWDDADQTEEQLSLAWDNEAWTASGMVGRENIQYVIRISPLWHVRQFLLFRDFDDPDLWLGTDGHGRWGEMNGAHRTDLDGCVDIDLPCTPFTQTLPIRRLPLHVGDSAEITVASIDVDTLAAQPEHQRYSRLGTHVWRVDRLERGITHELEVDDYGLVIDCPALFRRITETE